MCGKLPSPLKCRRDRGRSCRGRKKKVALENPPRTKIDPCCRNHIHESPTQPSGGGVLAEHRGVIQTDPLVADRVNLGSQRAKASCPKTSAAPVSPVRFRIRLICTARRARMTQAYPNAILRDLYVA